MPAVCPGMFNEKTPCPGDVDWQNWMQMAEERYKAYVHVQRPDASDAAEISELPDPAGEEGCEDVCDLGDFFASDSEASVDFPLEHEMEHVKALVGSYAGPKTAEDRAAEKEAERADGSVRKSQETSHGLLYTSYR